MRRGRGVERVGVQKKFFEDAIYCYWVYPPLGSRRHHPHPTLIPPSTSPHSCILLVLRFPRRPQLTERHLPSRALLCCPLKQAATADRSNDKWKYGSAKCVNTQHATRCQHLSCLVSTLVRKRPDGSTPTPYYCPCYCIGPSRLRACHREPKRPALQANACMRVARGARPLKVWVVVLCVVLNAQMLSLSALPEGKG